MSLRTGGPSAPRVPTKTFVDVENFFEDRSVADRYLPRAVTRTYPPGRGYGDGLLKMYRDRAAQMLFHQGDQRWRNREHKLARLQDIADSIFFQMFRVYAIARTRYGLTGGTSGHDDGGENQENKDQGEDDDDEDDEEEDDDEDAADAEVNNGTIKDDEESHHTNEDEDRVAFSRSSRRDIRSLLRRVRFFFAETNTRRVGRGDTLNTYGSKTPEQRAQQVSSIQLLHQHFYDKIVRFKSNVEDPLVMRMLKTHLTSEEASELFLISDFMFELIERQKIIAAAFERSVLMFAECVDFEKCVHSLYLTKLQLLNELRHTFNGNELNKDWLLVNEMLTVREHDVIMYERILSYSQNLLKPPYTLRNLSAFAFMCDVRNNSIDRLVTSYCHLSLVDCFVGHVQTLVSPARRFLEFLSNRALVLGQVHTSSHHVGGRGGGGTALLEYPADCGADDPRVQQFWHAVLVHCICLMPSAFITAVYTQVAKRETRWEIGITDILRYVDWLCGEDPTYICYTQKMIYRYLTFDESALNAQFSTLYDHQCILFALFVPNRWSPAQKLDELRTFMSSNTADVSVDLRQRPFKYGYTTAENSSPRRTAYIYTARDYAYGGVNNAGTDLDTEAKYATEQPHRPFTYDPRVCHTFPHLNQNYYKFLQHFYDLSVYRDTIRYGVHLVCEFLENVLRVHNSGEMCDDTDDTISANIEREALRFAMQQQQQHRGRGAAKAAAGDEDDRSRLPPKVLDDLRVCLQYTMNFVNANCWYYDGNFIHLNNAYAYYPLEKKKFLDRLRAYKPRFKQVHDAVSLDWLNLDEMIAACYRFVSTQTGKTAKIAKVVGNTHSTTGNTSVNQSFLRVNHGLFRVVMTNVHVDMYELVGPCVLFLLSLDTRNFGTDDGDQFPFGVNHNATEFVLQAWQLLPEYVRTIVSVDSFATLLYAPLVKEKRHETIFTSLDLAVTTPAATTTTTPTAHHQQDPSTSAPAAPADDAPTPKKRKKRNSLLDPADTWDSFTAISSKNRSRKKSTSSATGTGIVGAAAASSTGTPLPSNQKDKFIPYTIDREEFFQLANNLSLEWAHQAYSRLKSFKYFLAAMMQVLNQYGDRLFLYENGLRLSANVLLLRVRSPSERQRKRRTDLFADHGGGGKVEQAEDEEGDEANGDGGELETSTGQTVTTARPPHELPPPRFNLSQLLDTNTNATTIAQFFSGIVKQSLTDGDALIRFKQYFNRLPSDEARKLVDQTTAAPIGDDTTRPTRQRSWCSSLDPAYRQKGQRVRPLHEELLLMDNLTDLLFDLFHDTDFHDWAVETVDQGELYTNNLLDFCDKTFVGFFAAYLYVLRTIDTRNATLKSLGRKDVSSRPFRTLSDYFWRNGSDELSLLRRVFVARQVSSPNLLNTAIGLRRFIDMKHERNQLPVLRPSLTASKRDAICYFIMCTYTFSDCNLAYALFMFRLIMSIKFPGSWTKTITILQGSSNSGKSDFVEMIRGFFNSTNGVINPNVWRSATTNDIGTNLFPLMENLVCQSDEVDCINNTLLKTVVSKTAKQCRSFGSQESQQLHNLSKVFMSVNKQPHVDDPDEGVLTRMQIILPVFHKYQPRIRPETDTTKKHDMASFSPSHQFSFGRYPIGAHTLNYTVGLFYCYQNYGPYVVSKNVAAFKAADAIHLQNLSRLLSDDENGVAPVRFSSSTIRMIQQNVELQRYAVFIACHTNLDQTPHEFLLHASEPNYYLTHGHVQTVDSHDTKVFVDLTNQPMIAALFRIDSHANMDPMVKFDALYKVRPTTKPIDWSRIERVLRDHLIEFYNTEERGDSYSVASTGGTTAHHVMPEDDAESSMKNGGGGGGGNGAAAGGARSLSRRINFKAFYDRFKNRFAHMQHRDPQTRQLVPNKWCLSIKRIK